MKKETVREMTRNEKEVVIKAFIEIIKEHNLNFNEATELMSITRGILNDHIHSRPIPFEKKKENTTTVNSDVPNARFSRVFLLIPDKVQCNCNCCKHKQ